MKFIQIKEPGDADVLQIAESPPPEPSAKQVLIKVSAAGVNRPDILQRKGLYPAPPDASTILGLEIAGEIESVGLDCGNLRVGDKICALISGGGYAEYALADAALCLPIPTGLTDMEAAALPETFFTVWSNVFDRANLKVGEKFLVHGGSSGIGTTAIQLAKVFGATVYTTAGSDSKCKACLQLGADVAINYRESDFEHEIIKETSGQGIDVILDMVLGEYLNKNIHIAAEYGRIVIIAGLHGFKVDADFLPVMSKRLMITGSTLRPRSVEFKADIARKLENSVWPLLETKQIKPVVYQSFPLDQATDAHRLMESNEHIGKIVLTM